MAKRKIIEIDESICNGCGACIPNCPEGAVQVIDGKARLISDLFCDGLGACIGHCPEGAISVIEREAQEYDEKKVMVNIAKQGKNVIRAHLEHLKEHKQVEYLEQATEFLKQNSIPVPETKEPAFRGCPGSRIMDFRKRERLKEEAETLIAAESELSHWPVQIMLVPPTAAFLKNADLLIAADCVGFAYGDFHRDLLKGKALLVGCPKLDDLSIYQEKIKQIIKNNNLKSITYAHMEVPCCFGLVSLIREAISGGGKAIPFKEVIISIKGEKISDQ